MSTAGDIKWIYSFPNWIQNENSILSYKRSIDGALLVVAAAVVVTAVVVTAVVVTAVVVTAVVDIVTKTASLISSC